MGFFIRDKAGLFFSQCGFFGGLRHVLSSQTEEPLREKMVHLCRSTRQLWSASFSVDSKNLPYCFKSFFLADMNLQGSGISCAAPKKGRPYKVKIPTPSIIMEKNKK